MRRHYVYYRVPAAHLAAATAAVRAAQRRLCERHAGVQAELLRRPGDDAGRVTLMEVWVFADAAPSDDVEAAAAATAAPWQDGPRHVEVFVDA